MTVAIALAAVYALGTLLPGFALVVVANDAGALAAWAIAWFVFAAPTSLVVAFVGWRAEAMLSRSRPAAPWWIASGLGLVGVGHWLPMCAWSPSLAFAILLGRGDAVEHLQNAFLGLVAWVFCGGSVALALFAAQRLSERTVRDGRAPAGSWLLPTSLVVATGYGLSAALPAITWVAWSSGRTWGSAGTLGVWAWGLVGLGSAALAGGLTGLFVERGAALVPGLAPNVRTRQIEVAGAVLALHWGPVFLLELTGAFGDPDPRFCFLFAAAGAIVVGTAVVSTARTLRSVAEGSDAVS